MLSLLKGDCLDVMKTLPDKSIDCFVCDLPYGCLSGGFRATGLDSSHYAGYNTNPPTGCAWDVKIDLDAFWLQVKRLSRDDHTPVLMFCNTKFGVDLINSNPKWFRYDLVWNKMRGVSFLSANLMPMKSHEMIYVFSKKGAFYKRIDIEGEYVGTRRGEGTHGTNVYGVKPRFNSTTSTTHRCPLSVVNAQTKAVKGRHPTAKPEELYEWLLKRYCPEGGTMLDPTAGSFNSCFVAKELGLKAIGIEKDQGFFWRAVKRLH
jgi:site-specific DNA-methyltransferase (adenine-specific)